MAEKMSMLTQAGENAADFLFELRKKVGANPPIPFGQKKVDSSEIRRQVEGHMKNGTWTPTNALEMAERYGYGNLNEVVGRVVN